MSQVVSRFAYFFLGCSISKSPNVFDPKVSVNKTRAKSVVALDFEILPEAPIAGQYVRIPSLLIFAYLERACV